MGIQKEIKQSQFRNERLKGLVNIIFTYGWAKNKIKKNLKPYGITMQQFNVLRILNGQYPKPISTSEIRTRMLDKMSDASRIVDRLCKKGLAERQDCTHDKRLVDVLITEHGRHLISIIDEKAEIFDQLLGNLSEEEALQLNELLDKIRE